MTFPTVLRRELRSLIASPQTYFIAAGYFIISGIFFVNLLVTTQVPDLQRYYNNVATTLVVLVPIIAMRSFAEERKAGSLSLTQVRCLRGKLRIPGVRGEGDLPEDAKASAET